jgi:hypothetical protein
MGSHPYLILRPLPFRRAPEDAAFHEGFNIHTFHAAFRITIHGREMSFSSWLKAFMGQTADGSDDSICLKKIRQAFLFYKDFIRTLRSASPGKRTKKYGK